MYIYIYIYIHIYIYTYIYIYIYICTICVQPHLQALPSACGHAEWHVDPDSSASGNLIGAEAPS